MKLKKLVKRQLPGIIIQDTPKLVLPHIIEGRAKLTTTYALGNPYYLTGKGKLLSLIIQNNSVTTAAITIYDYARRINSDVPGVSMSRHMGDLGRKINGLLPNPFNIAKTVTKSFTQIPMAGEQIALVITSAGVVDLDLYYKFEN